MKPNYRPEKHTFDSEEAIEFGGFSSLESNLQRRFGSHEKYVREVLNSYESVQDMLDNGIDIFNI